MRSRQDFNINIKVCSNTPFILLIKNFFKQIIDRVDKI